MSGVRRKRDHPQVERLLVCGGRGYDDRRELFRALDAFNDKHGPVELVIHGGASGADSLAAAWAKERGLGIAEVPVTPREWSVLGKIAGSIRNQKMLDEWEPDAVYAFPGGAGTTDMIVRARRAGVRVFELEDHPK